MFTGIVSAIGLIETISKLEKGLHLKITTPTEFDLSDVNLGDSIALQGACMTVVAKNHNAFEVDVSEESLSKTVGLDKLGPVNLEKAMRLSDRIGGHLVTGHIDGIGKVLQFNPVGESHLLLIQLPKTLEKFFAYKGSATVNGVSLTINEIRPLQLLEPLQTLQTVGTFNADAEESTVCVMNLIPHTIQKTTLQYLQAGDFVNLEVDLIARYVERMLSTTI